MRRYSLFSNKLQSDITFKYGANGVLIGFEFADDKELTTAQLEEFVNNLPWSYQTLKAHCAKWKLKLTELVPDLSFTAFWNRYNYKDGGSKRKQRQHGTGCRKAKEQRRWLSYPSMRSA